MSTRSNIIITKKGTNDVWQYYHHSDGYLSGVGEDLRMFIRIADYSHKIFSEKLIYRGNRIGCLGPIIKGMDEHYEAEPKSGYSYDINSKSRLHGDIEYIYLIQESDVELEFYFLPIYALALDWFISGQKTYKEVIEHVTEKGIRLPIDISGERYTDDFEAYLINQKKGTNANESEDFEPVELMTLSSREITCETRGELDSALTAFNQVLDFIKWFGKDHTDNETLEAMKEAITESINEHEE